MTEIKIDGPCGVLCDNMTMVTTYQKPDASLIKKHNVIKLNRACEAVAAFQVMMGFEK